MRAVTVTLVRRYAHPATASRSRTKKVKAATSMAPIGRHGADHGDEPLAKTVNWRVTEIVERAK